MLTAGPSGSERTYITISTDTKPVIALKNSTTWLAAKGSFAPPIDMQLFIKVGTQKSIFEF